MEMFEWRWNEMMSWWRSWIESQNEYVEGYRETSEEEKTLFDRKNAFQLQFYHRFPPTHSTEASHPASEGIKIVQFSRLFMQVVAVIKMEKVFSLSSTALCKKMLPQSRWLASVCREMSNPFSASSLFSVVIARAHDHRRKFSSRLSPSARVFSTIFPLPPPFSNPETMWKNS